MLAYGAHLDYAPGDLTYLASWRCIEDGTACLFVPVDGPSVLLVDTPSEVERAREEAYADDIRIGNFPDDLAGLIPHEGRRTHLGVTNFRILPAWIATRLRKLRSDVMLVDAAEITRELRMIKSRHELRLLTEAAELTAVAIETALKEVEPGRSEAEIAASAEFTIRATGAELAFTTVMGSGPRTATGTFFPTARRVEAGDVLVLDCGARVEGYHGDMCRTVVVGPPTSVQRARLEAVALAVDLAVSSATPGVRIGDIQDAARQAIEDAGLGDYWWGYFMPHGAGTGQHEYPTGTSGRDEIVQEGMVLCIEPGITIPGEGAYILEDMVVIDRLRARKMASLRLDLWQ